VTGYLAGDCQLGVQRRGDAKDDNGVQMVKNILLKSMRANTAKITLIGEFGGAGVVWSCPAEFKAVALVLHVPATGFPARS